MENDNKVITYRSWLRFCSVKSCHSTSRKVKLFSIPRQLNQQQLWVQLLKPHCRTIKTADAKRLHLSVCILHFEEKFILPDGRRDKFAYPTLFTEEEIRTKQPRHTYTLYTENVVAYKENVELPLAADTSEENKYIRHSTHVEHTYCKPTIVKLVVETNAAAASQLLKPSKKNGQTQTDHIPDHENEAPLPQDSRAPSQSVGHYFAKLHCDLTNKETSTDNPNITQDSGTYISCEDLAIIGEETEFRNEILYDGSLKLSGNNEMDFRNEKLDDEILIPSKNEETIGDKSPDLTNNKNIEYLDDTLLDEEILAINEEIEFLDEKLDSENLKLSKNTDTSDGNFELIGNESFDVTNDDFIVIIPSHAGIIDVPSQVSLRTPQLRECKSKQAMNFSEHADKTDTSDNSELTNNDSFDVAKDDFILIIPSKTGTVDVPSQVSLEITQPRESKSKKTINSSEYTHNTEKSDNPELTNNDSFDVANDDFILIIRSGTWSIDAPSQVSSDIPQQEECGNTQIIYPSGIPQQTGCDNKQDIYISNIPQQSGCNYKVAVHSLNITKQTGYDNKQTMLILNLPQQTGYDNNNKQAKYILNLLQQSRCNNKQVIQPVLFSEPIKSTISSQMAKDDVPNIENKYLDEKQNKIREIDHLPYETQTEHVQSVIQKLLNTRYVGRTIGQQSEENSTASSIQPQQKLNETLTKIVSLQEDDSSLNAEESNENVDQILIQNCKPILTEGLKKDVKEKILQQYHILHSSFPLITPILNPIIMAVASGKIKNRETYLRSRQDQLGVGIVAINKSYQGILQNDIQKTVHALYDSCQIFSGLHNIGTMERKQLIAPAIKRNFGSLFRNQVTIETNFKDVLVKTATSDLKANTKTRRKLDTRNQTEENQIRLKSAKKRKKFHQNPN